MATRASNITGLITLILLAVLVGFLLLRDVPEPDLLVKDLQSVQGTDVSFGYTVEGGFDPRMIELSAFEKALIPEAAEFSYPMGADNGSFTYNAQKFMEENPARGGRHTGDDLNGIGGMNSDFGDAVYSIANGRVLYTGIPSKGWGRTVVIAHRLTDGTILQSMYAHLKAIRAVVGQTVERGKVIGEVGTADGQYLAHLHFEIRESTGIDIGAGYGNTKLNRIDPEAALKRLRFSPEEHIVSSPLPQAIRDEDAWETIVIQQEEFLNEEE